MFSDKGRALASCQREHTQYYPAPGRVEHDPEELWQSTVAVIEGALAALPAGSPPLSSVGITNQRETTIVWNRYSGAQKLRLAIPSSSSTFTCFVLLESRGLLITTRLSGTTPGRPRSARGSARGTGKTSSGRKPACRSRRTSQVRGSRRCLLLSLTCSGAAASKLSYLLETVPGLRADAEKGDALFGTVDCFLIWRLTGRAVHATDVTNASRTLLMDLRSLQWDDELLRIFGIPRRMLPQIKPSSGLFGEILAIPQLRGTRITGVLVCALDAAALCCLL